MLSWSLRKRSLFEDENEPAEAKALKVPKVLENRAPYAARNDSVSGAVRVRESALFRPVRAIGLVNDELPVACASLGTDDFITTSVRKGFQVFECKHLRLVYIGPRLNEKIRAIKTVGKVVLTALKKDIVAWHKLTELGRFRGHTSPATLLATVGSALLVSAAGAEVLVWQLSDVGLEHITQDEKHGHVISPLGKLDVSAEFGECTAMCHPPTYLHKMVLGSSTGELELWNVKTRSRIHSFKAHLEGWKQKCGVSCVVEAPNALDVVAVGFASGRIVLLNLREDRVLMELDQSQGRVTAISFRTGRDAPSHLISGAPNGAFVVWDLDKRRAHHVQEAAHRGPLSSAQFLPGQPILVTSGRDNSVKIWIFDTSDGLPRLLRKRTGCPGPARQLRFYGDGNDRDLIVGGGADGGGYVAKISFIQDNQNAEYSQSNLSKAPAGCMPPQLGHLSRLPPVVDMAYCAVRHHDWPAVVTAHERTEAAFVWSAQNQALAPMVLRPENVKDHAPVTSVATSACGNYCVLGLESGALHRFNLQSGLHRGSIPKAIAEPTVSKAGKDTAKNSVLAHQGRVCGVEITVGGLVVSVASHPRGCVLRVWKLMTHEAVTSIPLTSGRPGTPSALLLRAHGALFAVSLDDGTLLVVDVNTSAVVRTFNCGVPATDIAFGTDGRWLAAALRDGGLRIFDMIAARCVDSFTFARPALSLCFSPNSAFLLTSHSKGNAIQVWANKFLFDVSLSAPLLRPEPKEPIRIDEPGAPDEEAEEEEQKASAKAEDDSKAPAEEGKSSKPLPLEPDLLTLSDVPPSKWMATLHLDLVKERNKPTEPPKPLANAPFFLPTAHEGVKPHFVAPLDAGGDDEDALAMGNASRVLREDRSTSKGAAFQVMLSETRFDDALDFLREQTASGVHLAIEELGPLGGGDLGDLKAGLAFFEHHLGRLHFADEVQAYLTLFLQAHGEELASEEDLRERCTKLGQVLESRWSAINRQCHKVRCFLGMLTHTQTQW